MKRVVRVLCAVGIIGVLTGCAGLVKQAPQLQMQMDVAAMDRNDYVILDRVNGESTKTSIAFGAIQIIDGSKMIICGMRLFADQYARSPHEMTYIEDFLTKALELPTSQDRAYYKALAATPDADVIIPKTYDYEKSGIPVLFTHEKVNFKGKAIKLKTDKQLK